MSLSDDLKSLGSKETTYTFDKPNPEVLESFPSPLHQTGPYRPAWHGTIEITCPEFTSLCPKTGQPDFATIRIKYEPRTWCVESKSLKLYLMGFRNHGSFHEECVQRIAKDLVQLLDPEYLEVTGEFTPRGGIPFWPKVAYRR